MSPKRVHLLVALLLVAACGGESTVVQVDVASVTVGPTSPSVEVGLTVQLTASAFDASGGAITGRTVTWESDDPAVATVNSSGVATGVSAGSVPITATIDGVSGSQTLLVEATDCTSRTDVVLLPGQYASYRGDECLLLPAGTVGDVYRVAVIRPTLVSENTTNVANVTLSITPVAVAAGAPEGAEAVALFDGTPAPQLALARDQLPRIRSPYVGENLRRREATRRFHDELRTRERSLRLTSADLLPSAARVGGPLPTGHEPPATRDMYLDPSCSIQTKQEVTLVSFSDILAVYQETAERDTAAISTAAANELIDYYALYVKDMIEDYWGRLPDTDANGRVLIVTSPDLGENVAAAVFSADFAQDGTTGCRSNEGEVMYFSGEIIRALDDENHFALGVVAHEAKHIISLYNGIERGDPGPASFHDLWIEEGTAEISQVMSARIAWWLAEGGPAPNEPVTGQALVQTYQANGDQVPPEMSAVIDELAGITYALSSHPNSLLTDPDGAPDEHSFYLTSWHWHRFLGDAFGNASDAPFADSTFFRTLTDPSTPAGGASGELQITGRSFEQLFEDFVVAVSFQGSAFTPTYPIDTWDLLSATGIFSTPDPPGDYPWPVTANETNQWDPFVSASFSGGIGPAGVRFHDFRSSGTAGAQIQVTGSAQPCDHDGSQRCDRIIVSRLN